MRGALEERIKNSLSRLIVANGNGDDACTAFNGRKGDFTFGVNADACGVSGDGITSEESRQTDDFNILAISHLSLGIDRNDHDAGVESTGAVGVAGIAASFDGR